MSPHEGESALSLWFGIIPAIMGVLIALYIIARVIMDQREKRRVNADRPDPKVFKDYPELQAMVDQFYLARYKVRTSPRAEVLSAKERDELTRELDAIIERGLQHAEALRLASEPEEIIQERRAMAEVEAELLARLIC